MRRVRQEQADAPVAARDVRGEPGVPPEPDQHDGSCRRPEQALLRRRDGRERAGGVDVADHHREGLGLPALRLPEARQGRGIGGVAQGGNRPGP